MTAIALNTGERLFVEAEPASAVSIFNGGPDVVYYGDARVSSASTALTAGATVSLTQSRWFISAGSSKLYRDGAGDLEFAYPGNTFATDIAGLATRLGSVEGSKVDKTPTGGAGQEIIGPLRVRSVELSKPTNVALAPGGTLDAPSGGQVQRIYQLVEAAAGQTNGTRGDAITSDAANATNHSSLVGHELRSTGSVAYDEKGSLHQTYAALRVDPYVGGGDVYCEAFNHYAAIDIRRKGSLSGIAEYKADIALGAPARTAGIRLIMQEFNALTAYDAATFGAGSEWIATGARGLEIRAQGTGAAKLGTGIMLLGGAGFERAIVLNTAGVERFKVDGNGFVDIRRSGTGSTALRTFTDVDTQERLLVRADGLLQWTSGDSAAPGAVTLSRSGAAVLSVAGTLRASIGLGTQHVAAGTPTGGASGDIRVGTGRIWVNDAGTWRSVAVA